MGGLGSRPDDVLILDECDAGVRKLAKALGWLEELERLFKETHPEESTEDPKKAEKESMTKDQKLENEVEKLTTEIDNALKISNSHESRVRDELSNEKDNAKEQTKVETAEAERLEIPSVQGNIGHSGSSKSSSVTEKGEEAKPERLGPTKDDHDHTSASL